MDRGGSSTTRSPLLRRPPPHLLQPRNDVVHRAREDRHPAAAPDLFEEDPLLDGHPAVPGFYLDTDDAPVCGDAKYVGRPGRWVAYALAVDAHALRVVAPGEDAGAHEKVEDGALDVGFLYLGLPLRLPAAFNVG